MFLDSAVAASLPVSSAHVLTGIVTALLGLNLLFFRLLYVGQMTPRAQVEEIIAVHAARLADKDIEIGYLRGANDNLRDAITEQAAQLAELVDANRTVRDVVLALSPRSPGGRR